MNAMTTLYGSGKLFRNQCRHDLVEIHDFDEKVEENLAKVIMEH